MSCYVFFPPIFVLSFWQSMASWYFSVTRMTKLSVQHFLLNIYPAGILNVSSLFSLQTHINCERTESRRSPQCFVQLKWLCLSSSRQWALQQSMTKWAEKNIRASPPDKDKMQQLLTWALGANLKRSEIVINKGWHCYGLPALCKACCCYWTE